MGLWRVAGSAPSRAARGYPPPHRGSTLSYTYDANGNQTWRRVWGTSGTTIIASFLGAVLFVLLLRALATTRVEMPVAFPSEEGPFEPLLFFRHFYISPVPRHRAELPRVEQNTILSCGALASSHSAR